MSAALAFESDWSPTSPTPVESRDSYRIPTQHAGILDWTLGSDVDSDEASYKPNLDSRTWKIKSDFGVPGSIKHYVENYVEADAPEIEQASMFSYDNYMPVVFSKLGRMDFHSAIKLLNSASYSFDLQKWSRRIQDLIDMRAEEEPHWTPSWISLTAQIALAIKLFDVCQFSREPQTGLSPRSNFYLEWRGDSEDEFLGVELLDSTRLGFVISSKTDTGAPLEIASDDAPVDDFLRLFETRGARSWL